MTKTTTNKASFITRTKADYSSKLKKLEEEKQQLILARKEEIFNLIDKTNCLSIENELLAGAFTILKEIDGKKAHDLPDNLKAFEALVREKSPIFFRRKTKSKLSTTEPDIK